MLSAVRGYQSKRHGVMFPSPAARDWRSGKGRTENGHTPQLPEVVGGQLNPDWVEALMGWPPGWTALPTELGQVADDGDGNEDCPE